MLKDILTPKSRKIAYLIFAIVGVALGATVAGFAAAAVAIPMVVKVALAVYSYLGVAFGFTAAANTPSETPQNRI